MSRGPIVHVLSDPAGGGRRQALLLARHQVEQGHRVVLYQPAPAAPAEGVDVELLPEGDRSRTRVLASAARSAAVLHIHGTRAGAWALPVLPAARSVLTFHGLHPLRRPASPRYRLAAWALVRAEVAAVRAAICVAENERATLERMRIPVRKLHVVPNGVPSVPRVSEKERQAARADLGLPPDAYVIAWIGRMAEQKVPSRAVEIARGLDDATLLMVGDGPLAAEARREAPPSVRFVGAVPDARPVMAAASVLLNPSLWEGLPLAVLEAMWAGLPVVASDVDGNREALGTAGWLVPRHDVEGYRAALRELRDPAVRERLAQAARVRVVQRFSLERMLRETDAVYARVTAT